MATTYTWTAKKSIPLKPKITPIASTGTTGVSSISPTSTTAVKTPVPTSQSSVNYGTGTQKKAIPLKKVLPTSTTPPNTGAVDTFWASSGNSTLWQTVTPGGRLSTGETFTKDTAKKGDLGALNVWGQNAIAAETANAGTLTKRNDQVVQNLIADGITDEAGIKSYLEWQDGFLDANPEEQANTLRALTEQMGSQPTTDLTSPEQTREEKLNEDVEGNIMAKEAADLVTQTEKDKAFLQSQQDKMLQIQDLEGNNIEIERSQRLQAAEKQVADMKQRYAYLGSQWQPGTSAVQFDAVQKQIASAEQTYAQLKQFEQNAAQMRELGIDVNAEQFEKQMSDLTYKLDQQVSRAVQDTINQFNAESGGIDTMEELNTVREKLMDSLDKSVANIALSNQTERGLILDSYKKSIEFGKEYAKNANTVNNDMSEVLGYYVNGNGSPIFWSNWLPIPIPPKAPMEPIFDKDSGTFITFSSWENGQIIANPQQILPSKQNARQKGDDGSFYRTGVDGNLEFANGGGVSGGVSWTNWAYTWATIPSVPRDQVMSELDSFVSNAKVGTKGGQCASFVNNYLQDMGLGRLFVDPIDIRKTQTNSKTPTVGSVAVFDYGNNPNVSQAAQKYGHVAIVTGVNWDGSVNILESNGKSNEIIGTRTVPANKVYGYFDPTKGLKPEGSYDKNMLSTYTQFVETGKKPTEKQIAQLGGIEKFTQDANQAYLDTQNKVLGSQNMSIDNPDFYVSMNADDRKQFKADAKTIKNVTLKIDDIIRRVQTDWLPNQTLSGKWSELKALVRDLQLQMKGEGLYNLWVLNWPDLSLLESVIPTPDLIAKAWWKDNFINKLVQARDMFTNQINTQNVGNWVSFNPPPAPGGKSNTGFSGVDSSNRALQSNDMLLNLINKKTTTPTTSKTPVKKVGGTTGKAR